MPRSEKEIRKEIARLVEEFYEAKYSKRDFVAGKSPVHYAGRVFDAKEMKCGVEAVLDFWLTAGRFSDEFESAFSDFVSAEFAFLVNSGSSANLIAFSSLMSPLLYDRRLKAGDEIITAAAGFPTTLNPILQNGMVPVFVDVDVGTYNVNVEQVAQAIGPKTKAIFLAHTLGNPYDLNAICKLAKESNLWLIEDCSDALGSTFDSKLVGSFGDIATCSFYPAHHITMGEGGCVFTSDAILAKAARSLRDWGRDCYCNSGESNTCGKRFSGVYGTLPKGYDHKYVYSHIGYNLKVTDIQAAIGVEQLKKLPGFIDSRRRNFQRWFEGFSKWEDRFILPRALESSNPSWFGFPVTVRNKAGFSRTQIAEYLNAHLIETRNLFGGNLLRQPAYEGIAHRVGPGGLTATDQVMNDTFFLGTYPGLSEEQIRYALGTVQTFLDSKASR